MFTDAARNLIQPVKSFYNSFQSTQSLISSMFKVFYQSSVNYMIGTNPSSPNSV